MSSVGEMPVGDKNENALIGVIDAGTRTIRFAVSLKNEFICMHFLKVDALLLCIFCLLTILNLFQ